MGLQEARDFVDRLLVLQPSKRYTAEEALRHPFILSVTASAEKAPSGCLFSALSLGSTGNTPGRWEAVLGPRLSEMKAVISSSASD